MVRSSLASLTRTAEEASKGGKVEAQIGVIGFRVSRGYIGTYGDCLGFRDRTLKTENQVGKKTEDEMETVFMQRLLHRNNNQHHGSRFLIELSCSSRVPQIELKMLSATI